MVDSYEQLTALYREITESLLDRRSLENNGVPSSIVGVPAIFGCALFSGDVCFAPEFNDTRWFNHRVFLFFRKEKSVFLKGNWLLA